MKGLSETLTGTAENISAFSLKIRNMDKEVNTAMSALKEGETPAVLRLDRVNFFWYCNADNDNQYYNTSRRLCYVRCITRRHGRA